MSSVQPNILLLQLEFPTWATARPWTYSANFAVQEGLEAAGAQCSTIPVIAEVSCASPSSWVYHARRQLAGRTFDQVWVWLVHAPLDPSTLEWIAGLAPVRVGIIMESLRYAPDDYAWAPHLQERQRHVEEQIGYMTHVLTFDEQDAEDLNARRVAKALWWPPMVCERFIATPSMDPSHHQAVFHGTPYGPRQRWIGNPVLRDRLVYHQSGPPTQYQRLFDQLQQQAGVCIGQGGVNEALIRHYVQTWRTIRLGEFQEWMAGLAQWPAIVNLPTLAKFYGGRVFEGMAAGRPVISWKIDERPKNLALFEDGRDILLFPPDDPHALSRHIDRLRHDPSLAHSIAASAQHKLRAFHTAERRLRETLSWIGTGIEPSYGLASAPPQQGLSVTAMPMRDGTASRGLSLEQTHHHPLVETRQDGKRVSLDMDVKTTVFVLTVGDDVFESCQAALDSQQSGRFVLEIIRDVSPFSAAAQEMIRRCRTPYFIQVDEDMILAPDAVGTMEAAMDAAPDDIGMICFHLYDEDRELKIQGVKIYRTSLLRELSFLDVKASEMDLLDQMGARDIKWILHPDVKGRHGTQYTIESIYRRYKTMYEKDIREWNILTADVRRKAERFRATGDPLQLFALLGAVHGIVHAPVAANREKDARHYALHELDVFKRLFMQQPPVTQAYDVKKSGKPVRNQPIPLDQVRWKTIRTSETNVSPSSVPLGSKPPQPVGRKRVLLVTPLFWPSVGGVERVAEELGVGLVAHGYHVDVATYPVTGRDRDEHRGIHIITVANHDQVAGDLRICILQVERLLQRGHYAACILLGAPSNAIFYGALTDPFPAETALIVQPTMNEDVYRDLVKDDFVRPLFLTVARRARAVVTLSEQGPDARFLREHNIPMVHIPNGVTAGVPSGTFRTNYGIPADAFVILHVANLYAVKNHLGLLRAFDNLPTGAKVVMVGRPSEERAYVRDVQDALRARPDVLYIPGLSAEEVAAAMEEADLLVLASHSEASPLCILEAMSHRLTWLATPECGAVSEHAGGIMTELDTFSSYIRCFMQKPELRRALADAGYQHWQACYQWRDVLQGWIEVIEQGALTRSFSMPDVIRKSMASLAQRVQTAVTPQDATELAQASPTTQPATEDAAMNEKESGQDRHDRFYVDLFVHAPAWSAPHPNADEAARWSKIASFLEYILRRMQQKEPGRQLRILDVGCGRGWLTNLATMYGTCEGVEPVAGVVEHARKLFPHLRFEAGTPESLLQRSDFSPYDVILTSEVIEHVPHGHKEIFLAHLAQLLDPNGYLILTTPRGEMWEQWKTIAPPNQPVEDWVTEDQLRTLFASQGFVELGLERIHVQMPGLRYVPAPTPADFRSMNLLPIYQVWVCQRGVDSRHVPMTRVPKVSVILPTYNRPDRLRTALASLTAQTYQDFEIIVVNDAGREVESVIAACPDRHRITTICHDRNRGLAAARNTGLRAAKGTYVAYLDDDDRYLPHHLETLVTYLERNECRIAYTDAWRVHERQIDGAYIEVGRDVPYSHEFSPADLLVCNYFPVLCVMHARQCLDEVGYFDEALFAHEDWDLWIRMATRFPFKHLPVTTAEFTWRNDGTSMTSGTTATYRRTTEIVYHKYRPYADLISGVREAQQQHLDKLKAQTPSKSYVCSIIMPVHNRLEMTSASLTALSQIKDQPEFEVLVVDNGSTDGTAEFLQQLGGDLRVITNQENLGFARACNQGAQAARGRYLVFLNNDTIPQPGWLSALVSEVDAHSEVGIVGSKLLYPDGTVQHAGVIRDCQHLLPYHIYKHFAGDHPAVNQRREFQIVTAACLLIRRQLFDDVGGFDEAYVNGFEDADLCLKVRDRGHAVVYQPRSVVVHLESQTPGRKTHEDANATRFLNRWGSQWWAADEDKHFYVDGYKLKRVFRNGQLGGDIQLIDDLKDRAAWAHVAAAQTAALKQDWRAVRRELSLAEEWPNDRYALSWGAIAAERLQEPVYRVRFLSRALALMDAPAERVALVRTFLEQKNLVDAEAHLRMVLEASPNHPEGLLLKSILCMQREQYEQAEATFESALREGANRKKCLMGMGMAAMGRAYVQGAWDRFLQVLEEDPDDAEALHWLLRAGTEQNRWEGLSRYLRAYVLRNPADLAIRFALAGVLIRGEQIEEARGEYDILCALAPTFDGLNELHRAIAGKQAMLPTGAAQS